MQNHSSHSLDDYPTAAFWVRQRQSAGNWASNVRKVLRAAKLNYARLGTIAALKFYQKMQSQYLELLRTCELWIARCNAELAMMGEEERLAAHSSSAIVLAIIADDECCEGV